MDWRRSAFRLVSVALIVALQWVGLAALAADTPASVDGSISTAVGERPIAGARLLVGDTRSGEVYRSAPTSADGRFSVDGLPASTYRLAVEAKGGLYEMSTALRLSPGATRSFDVVIQPRAEAAVAAQTGSAATKMGFWNNPLTAALIVAGSAFVIGWAVKESRDDDEPLSSPF